MAKKRKSNKRRIARRATVPTVTRGAASYSGATEYVVSTLFTQPEPTSEFPLSIASVFTGTINIMPLHSDAEESLSTFYIIAYVPQGTTPIISPTSSLQYRAVYEPQQNVLRLRMASETNPSKLHVTRKLYPGDSLVLVAITPGLSSTNTRSVEWVVNYKVIY